MGKIRSGFAFHCHHDTLFEWVWDFEERVRHIKEHKPQKEQGLRLKLFQMIPSERLPQELLKAWAAYDKAWAACAKAKAAYDKAKAAYYGAWADYDKAVADCAPQMEALHKELCPDCPWDGKTIFPQEVK